MSRTLMAVLALSAAAACAAAATTNPDSPSESAIVDQVSDRLAGASATMGVSPATAPAPVQPAQYTSPALVRAAYANLTCEIRATPTAQGVRLEGLVHSSSPTSGTYELTITKSGHDGSADVSQGGEFDTTDGPTAELDTTELSLERGARFHARLDVEGDDGASCRDELS